MKIPFRKDLQILQGKNFELAIQWQVEPIIYKPITAITQSAPVRITALAHGIPDKWPVAVIAVKGMTQLNAKNNPPRASDYHVATVIDADTIEFNDVSSAEYKAYVSGGYLQFYTPKDLTGYDARMSIKDKIGGTELLSLTTANSRILIDVVGCVIKLDLDATDTEAITWKKGVYDLELVSPSGVVTALLYGAVSVTQEVTT